MKNFIVSITKVTDKFTEFTVYVIKKNIPHLVGDATYQNCIGAHIETEVLAMLKEHREVKAENYPDKYYYKSKANFRIHLV
jgi:hypothetical protein